MNSELIEFMRVNLNGREYDKYCNPFERIFIIKPRSFMERFPMYDEFISMIMRNGFTLFPDYIGKDDIISRYQKNKFFRDKSDKIISVMRKPVHVSKERGMLIGTENRDDKSRDRFSIRSYGRDMQRIRDIKARIGLTE